MKKKVLFMLVAASCMLLLAGCGKKREYANGEVYVYNWGQYLDMDVIEMFEDKYDIEVHYDEFEENEDMYPIIEKGSVMYDVVCPSDYMISKMIENNLLEELNYENIPNLSYIDPDYLKKAQDFDPGNKYAVPYCWGTLGILYNKTKVSEPIDSWSAIFDPKYKNEILMMDSVRDAMGIALMYLGYSMNSQNEAEIEEAKALLTMQNPLVQAYVVDQVRDKMIGGEAVLGVIYSGEAIYTKRENSDLEYVVPKEGSNVWMDCWVIPKNSKNKENAEKWIDFMCSPEIALLNFEEITYSTPNKGARELIEDPDIKNSLVAFPDEETLSRCKTYVYLGEKWDTLYIQKFNEAKMQK